MPRWQTQEHTSIETIPPSITITVSPVLASTISLQARRAETSQLPGGVPQCARRCLSEHVRNGFKCASNDLSCLCSQYSDEGFTLGELAYTCLQLECGSRAVEQNSLQIYNICSAEREAVQATHSTLTLPATATVFATSGPASNTAAAGLVTSTSSSRTRTTLQTSTTSRHSTILPASTETASAAPTPASHTSTATPVAAAANHASSTLTTAQAVGVAIAAIGGLMLIIAAILLYKCVRHRRGTVKQRDERDSYDFIDADPARISPFSYGSQDPRGPLGGSKISGAELSDENRRIRWPKPEMLHKETAQHMMGGDRSPRQTGSIRSHRSDGSMRTLSQLLPEKPTMIPRKPLPVAARPASTFTAATIFEEDRSPKLGSPVLGRFPFPAPPPQVHAALAGFPSRPEYASNWTRSPDAVGQPSLSLHIPPHYSSREKIAPPIAFPPPPIPSGDSTSSCRSTSNTSRTRSAHSSQPRSSTNSNSYLPNYYMCAESRTPTTACPTPIEDEVQKRRPAPTSIIITKPTYPPKAFRSSGASDTSFESTDPDEPTPPEESDKQLTPVEESPIAAIRYPKVPRSSNQAVPRSPKPTLSARQSLLYQSPRTVVTRSTASLRHQHSRDGITVNPRTPERPNAGATHGYSLSGSTLAAKRRGSQTAQDLQKRLQITDSALQSKGYTPPTRKASITTSPRKPEVPVNRKSPGRQTSPLAGYGTTRTPTSALTKSSAKRAIPGTMSSALPQKPLPQQNLESTLANLSSWQTRVHGPGQGTDSAHGSLFTPERKHDAEQRASALWEPKLTPSRRGEDLFLSVGLASPAPTKTTFDR